MKDFPVLKHAADLFNLCIWTHVSSRVKCSVYAPLSESSDPSEWSDNREVAAEFQLHLPISSKMELNSRSADKNRFVPVKLNSEKGTGYFPPMASMKTPSMIRSRAKAFFRMFFSLNQITPTKNVTRQLHLRTSDTTEI